LAEVDCRHQLTEFPVAPVIRSQSSQSAPIEMVPAVALWPPWSIVIPGLMEKHSSSRCECRGLYAKVRGSDAATPVTSGNGFMRRGGGFSVSRAGEVQVPHRAALDIFPFARTVSGDG
jgi:hypothetical protein